MHLLLPRNICILTPEALTGGVILRMELASSLMVLAEVGRWWDGVLAGYGYLKTTCCKGMPLNTTDVPECLPQ